MEIKIFARSTETKESQLFLNEFPAVEDFKIEDVEIYFCDECISYDSITEDQFNELLDIMSNRSDEEIAAIIQLEGFKNLDYFLDLFNSDIEFYSDVSDDRELGYKLTDYGFYNIPEELECYINYEAIGRDYRLNNAGFYSDYGFISLN